jgi:hypothetical protein
MLWNEDNPRIIKQNKAAAAILKDYLFQKKMETGKNIACNYTVTCIMCAVWYIMQDIWTGL